MRLVDADELYKLPCVHGAEGTWIRLEDIRNIPTEHGRWVNHVSEDGATDGIYCSICDYEIDRDARYNYCPNCGAKMTLD